MSCYLQLVENGKLNIYYLLLFLFKKPLKLFCVNSNENEQNITNRISYVLEKVIYRRKRLSLTQTDLANKLEITLSAYYKMETGRTKLDVRRLFELSEILKVEVDYFLNEQSTKKTQVKKRDFLLDF